MKNCMDCKEFPLAHTSDLRAGEMKEVSVGERKSLLARVGNRFHAVSATCPHYGAPLVKGMPFFWTRQFDRGLLYVGHARAWDEIIYQGEVSSGDFLAFYVKDGRALAVAGMNREREMAAAEELMWLGRVPTADALKVDGVSLLEVLHNPV